MPVIFPVLTISFIHFQQVTSTRSSLKYWMDVIIIVPTAPSPLHGVEAEILKSGHWLKSKKIASLGVKRYVLTV